jgi:hypothetical protein
MIRTASVMHHIFLLSYVLRHEEHMLSHLPASQLNMTGMCHIVVQTRQMHSHHDDHPTAYVPAGALQACCQEALASKTWHVAREALKQLHTIMVDINDNSDGSKVSWLGCRGIQSLLPLGRVCPLIRWYSLNSES